MNIIVSSIDESENKKELAEWLSLPSYGDSLTTEWGICDVEMDDGVKLKVNASLTNDSSNLSIDIAEDGVELFAGHFSLNRVALLKLKSKTGCWLEFIISLNVISD